jgi:membrane protein DedA with SNARE-associated domain
MLHARAVLSDRLARTPYRVFALINTIGAVGWGAAFVWTGYVLARSWHGGKPNWSDIALLLTTTAAILGIDLGLRHRAHRGSPRRSGAGHDRAPTAPNHSG